MNNHAYIFGALLLLGACSDQNSKLSDAGVKPMQNFHTEIYQSSDGASKLSLTSPEQCEFSRGSKTFLCSYTRDNESLRMLVPALGSTEVVYLKKHNDNYVTDEGKILLSANEFKKSQEIAQENTRQLEMARNNKIKLESETAAREANARRKELDERFNRRENLIKTVENFFSKGAVISGEFQPLYSKKQNAFSLQLTGSLIVERDKGYVDRATFSVPAKMTWLGDPELFHSFSYSSQGGSDKENLGLFVGTIQVSYEGSKDDVIYADYANHDGQSTPTYQGRGDSYWNGKEFRPIEREQAAHRFYKKS